MRTYLFVLSGAILISVLACQPAVEEPAEEAAPTIDADLEAIEQTFEELGKAARAADWTAMANCFSTDAVIMPSNEATIVGRDAFQAWNEAAYSGVTLEEFDAMTEEIEISGDLAFARGTYRMTMKPAEGKPIRDIGKFIEIWQRQADGSWKISHEIWNSDKPLPAPAE
jgi:uncharacterized protein (TIGR02246 family)